MQRRQRNCGWTQMDADGALSVCIGVNLWFNSFGCGWRRCDKTSAKLL
jgi:hypothetical protein